MAKKYRKNWDLIKADYCSGELSVQEVAIKYAVKAGTLRSRASREGWPTPGRFSKTMREAVQMANEIGYQGLRGAEDGGAEAQAIMGETPTHERGPDGSMQQLDPRCAKTFDALQYQQTMAEFACRAAAAGIGKVRPPANWREIATADTIARRALGLDSKGGGAAGAMIRITPGDNGVIDVAAMAYAEEADDLEDDA